MNKLKINTWTGIFDIVDCVVLAASWFAIFASSFNSGGASTNASFFYIVQWIGVVLHIIALYKSRQAGISIVGSVLGLIGCALSGFALAFAFPSIVLLIIATVFLFLQRPAKNGGNTDAK